MRKLFVLFTVMLMAMCLFGLAGFTAAGAPPGVASVEGTFNVIEIPTDIHTDIAGGADCAIFSATAFLPAIASASNFESNTNVTHAGGGSAIASAVIAHDGGDPTEYMITSALMDHDLMDQASHVLGGCTCFTFAEPIAV